MTSPGGNADRRKRDPLLVFRKLSSFALCLGLAAGLSVSPTAQGQPATPGSTPSSGKQDAAKPEPGATPAEEPPPAQVKKARDLWYRGVEAFRNEKYDEARQAFAECYELMPKSDVLRNLSISEIHSGHYVSAARHLTQLLAAPGELPSNVREEATNRLAQAEAQIGQLSISVDVAGADIAVDGASIGRAPLQGNWYIEPGQHEVSVSKEGYPTEERQVFALAGVSIPVSVSLETLRRERAADEKAAQLMGTSEGQAPPTPTGDDRMSTASTVTLITTSTLAAVGLAAGVYFTVAANGHDSDAEGAAAPLPLNTQACTETQLTAECARLKQDRDDARHDRQRAAVGFVVGGVAAAATLGYVLWLALDGSETESAAAATPVEPSVSVGPGWASISLRAQF